MAGKHSERAGPLSSDLVAEGPPEGAELEEAPARSTPRLGSHSPESDKIAAVGTEESPIPDRYSVRDSSEHGPLISCRESPNIVAHVERGYTVTAATARKAPSGSIFLDGAAQEAPFLDTERHVYNLDHHEGVVRSFTLSTCEQAYILIRKGLGLRDRDWTVLANEPDLDTLLAIWLLLNHGRVNDEDPEIRNKILPLVRLEGVIDVHGLELEELAVFAEPLLGDTQAMLSQLHDRELELKREGEWPEIDFAHYAADMLRRIDRMIYSQWHFQEFHIVDQLARVEITENHVAVICHSEAGIYEVEKQLTALHGDRLGMIVLQKDEAHYTIRKTNLFLPASLERVYAQLNMLDPVVGGGRSENRWGGSSDIGGSPRLTGTQLKPSDLAEALLRAFHKPTFLQVLSSLTVSAIVATISLLAGWVVTQFWDAAPANFIAPFAGCSAILLLLFARQHPRVFGIRIPVTTDWWWLLPAALVAGLSGGVWLPARLNEWDVGLYLLMLLGLPLAAEILFRSTVHGLLSEELRTQISGGRWFLSGPAIVSAFLYAGATLAPFLPVQATLPFLPQQWIPTGLLLVGIHFLAAFLFGLIVATVRERSESVWTSVAFHWLCAFSLVAAGWLNL